MKLTVVNATDGSVEAHRAGCADLVRGANRHNDKYTAEFTSERAAFLDYNSDFIYEADGDESNTY